MQQNPYDFIMQADTKPKKGLFSGKSTKNRILVVVVIGGILLIVGLIAVSFISNLGKDKIENLYSVAAAQEDLLNITDQYASGIKSSSAANQSATLNIVLISQNREIVKAITKAGIKKPSVYIGPLKVTSYKKVLDDAKVKGTYEDAYVTLLANRLDEYRIKLNTAYSATNDEVLKNKLASYYQQINLVAPQPEKESAATPTPSSSN